MSGRNDKKPKARGVNRWSRLASGLFAGEPMSETVATRLHFGAVPENIWDRILFYEEVPGRSPLLLRAFLTQPVRTEGNKSRTGECVRYFYGHGQLVKRITAVQPPLALRFEVIEQHLGIEESIRTLGGSYQITACGNGADVVLTTHYRTFLRPRLLWRRLETLLVHQLHGHILQGIRQMFPKDVITLRLAVRNPLPAQGGHPGGLACTTSQLGTRRFS